MRYETFGHKDKRNRSNRKQLQSKRVLAGAFLLLVLAVPVTAVPVMVNAQETEQSSGALQEQASGTLAAADVVGSAEKKEVVYATLDGSGANKSAYVVNVLEGNAGETVQDFGAYEQVVNLTDTSELTQLSDSVIATLPEGEFSYQGSLSDAQTPWNISLKYFLDGQEISPNEVAG